VSRSSSARWPKAWVLSKPHISRLGAREAQTGGRSTDPNNLQDRSGANCTQGTPADLPAGIPGMGLLMEGAMQQAAQPGRQTTPGSGGARLRTLGGSVMEVWRRTGCCEAPVERRRGESLGPRIPCEDRIVTTDGTPGPKGPSGYLTLILILSVSTVEGPEPAFQVPGA